MLLAAAWAEGDAQGNVEGLACYISYLLIRFTDHHRRIAAATGAAVEETEEVTGEITAEVAKGTTVVVVTKNRDFSILDFIFLATELKSSNCILLHNFFGFASL